MDLYTFIIAATTAEKLEGATHGVVDMSIPPHLNTEASPVG